jgi:ferric hydroxamate transport system permease protein
LSSFFLFSAPWRNDPAVRFRSALTGAVLVMLTVFVTALMIGPTPITLGSFADALLHFDPQNEAHLVARDIRLPRALLALLVGGSLAASGAVMQGVTRNPLAGPSIMGLSGGGSLATLAALILVPALTYNGSIAASMAGAALGYGCVLAVACLSPNGFAPTRLALAGAVTSALFSAVTQGLVIALAMSGNLLFWTMGGIANVTWGQVTAITPWCVVGLAGVHWLSPGITILSLGDEVAIGLGQRLEAIRVGTTLCVLLLTGSAVAVAGPVGFVGLMVPHACRFFGGADYRRLIPLSTVVGAALTEAADIIGRLLAGSGGEIPLGIVTAILGAPAFLWLIWQHRRQRLDGGAPMTVAPRNHRPPRHILAILVGLLIVTVMGAVQLGYSPLSPAAIVRAVLGYGTPEEHLVMWSFRLPRIAFAILVGGGIAVSGAVLQGVLRNDLAEPGMLGISAGVSLAIVLSLGLTGYAVQGSTFAMPLAAVGGALAAMLLVCLLCFDGQSSSPRLVLTGVAVSAALSAVTMLVSLRISSDAHAFAVAFSAGSLSTADWNYVLALALWLGLLVPIIWSFAPTLNVLRLGDQAATGLGVPVRLSTFLLLGLSVAACAACMAFAGGVLFLGLIAPHIARRLVGADHAAVIPASGLLGACLLILADVLGCRLFSATEIPAGIMVSALGAPYFLYLLTRP